jgi:hypothetical protein
MKKRRTSEDVQREITAWFWGAVCGHGNVMSRAAKRRWVAMLRAAGLAASIVLMAGCATRATVMVDSQRDMVLIVKPVKADVAVWQGGRWVENGKAVIPAGWVAGPERKP